MIDLSTRPEPFGEPLRGVRVLVVEDDFIILMELETILGAAGAETAGCGTVKDAIALAERNGLAAAVLDIDVCNAHMFEPDIRRDVNTCPAQPARERSFSGKTATRQASMIEARPLR